MLEILVEQNKIYGQKCLILKKLMTSGKIYH